MNSSNVLALCRGDDDLTPSIALCKVIITEGETPTLCSVVLDDKGDPPEWIQLFPDGPIIEALDGRKFLLTDPDAVIARFVADPRKLPLDLEHATEVKAPWGDPAPAYGWIVAMENRDGSIWGKVEWTEDGATLVRKRAYRYISPAFYHDENGEVQEITSAALTNKPALVLAALARAKTDVAKTRTEERSMNPELLKLLGLAEGATDEAVNDAVKKMVADNQASSGLLDEAGKKAEEATEELATTRTKLKTAEADLENARKAAPSLTEYVPRADYNKAVTRANDAEAKIAESDKAAQQKEIDHEIDAALKAGKITPATVDYHKSQCSAEGGLAAFKEFVEAAPVVVADDVINEGKPPAIDPKNKSLTDLEKTVAAKCGMTHEEYAAGRDTTIG